jgi:ATP-binding cassette, subfamily A (ABC1), member 5
VFLFSTSYFSFFKTAKASIGIEEYSFSQTTLEQVFLKLAHFDEETTSEVRIE